jgi:hypothetical protein
MRRWLPFFGLVLEAITFVVFVIWLAPDGSRQGLKRHVAEDMDQTGGPRDAGIAITTTAPAATTTQRGPKGCCTALAVEAHDAADAQQRVYLKQAAAACHAAVAQGKHGSLVRAIVEGAARGSSLPAVCHELGSAPDVVRRGGP